MIFNVASLLTASEGASRQMAIQNGEVYADRHRFSDVDGPVEMLRTDKTILVTATITASVDDICSRCLQPARLKVTSEFEEEFEPVNRDLVSDRPAPVESDFDPALVIDSRNMLDMTDALAQALSLAMPLAPLCSTECAGICTVCFANRNESNCNCDDSPIDPRWGALAELSTLTTNSKS